MDQNQNLLWTVEDVYNRLNSLEKATFACFAYRQLVLAWLAVVQDYAVLGSHGPLVQSAYTPRLLQPLDLTPTPSIISGMEPHLQACWPAALRALAAILPQAQGNFTLSQTGCADHILLDFYLDMCTR